MNIYQRMTAEEVYEALTKPVLEFFNIGGVWQLVPVKHEKALREHELQHARMRWGREWF